MGLGADGSESGVLLVSKGIAEGRVSNTIGRVQSPMTRSPFCVCLPAVLKATFNNSTFQQSQL